MFGSRPRASTNLGYERDISDMSSRKKRKSTGVRLDFSDILFPGNDNALHKYIGRKKVFNRFNLEPRPISMENVHRFSLEDTDYDADNDTSPKRKRRITRGKKMYLQKLRRRSEKNRNKYK